MKVKLLKEFGITREDDAPQAFFGVTFHAKNRKQGGNNLCEWFADIDAKDAKLMEDAGRVDIILEAKKDK